MKCSNALRGPVTRLGQLRCAEWQHLPHCDSCLIKCRCEKKHLRFDDDDDDDYDEEEDDDDFTCTCTCKCKPHITLCHIACSVHLCQNVDPPLEIEDIEGDAWRPLAPQWLLGCPTSRRPRRMCPSDASRKDTCSATWVWFIIYNSEKKGTFDMADMVSC